MAEFADPDPRRNDSRSAGEIEATSAGHEQAELRRGKARPMNRYRRPAEKHAGGALPHQTDREKSQPYAKENEDYSGGVVQPPKEQVGKREECKAPNVKSSRPSHPAGA